MSPEREYSTSKAGMAPGSLVYTGERRLDEPIIRLTRYSARSIEEFRGNEARDLMNKARRGWNRWLDVRGLHDVDLLERIGERFNLHPLLLEDILHTSQRPKIETHDDVLFFILRRFTANPDDPDGDQISIVLGRGFVLTFQEGETDTFTAVRQRINAQARVRFLGPDYLAYALVDCAVDEYFEVMEKMSDDLDDIQADLMEKPGRGVLNRIHHANRRIIDIRRAVRPLKDAVQQLERDNPRLLSEDTTPFIRDLRDHIVQVAESAELFRETLAGLLNTYLAGAGMRTNEAMRILAVISTTFIPLSFLAGLYGMNFKHMPELEWRWAYPAILSLMAGIAGSLMFYFKRKKWF